MSRRVAIVGAGLAGVCTAFELAALGCEVRVFERHGSVAEQASFAGSATLMPPLPLGPRPPAPLSWRWRSHRTSKRQTPPQELLLALGQLSLERTAELRRMLGVDDESATGLLVALTTTQQQADLAAALPDWKALGLAAELLDAEAARRLEPGLAPEAPLLGGLSLTNSGTGNARRFAQQLRLQAQRLGARFSFHTTVRALQPEGKGWLLRHEYTPPAEAPVRGQERDAGDTQPQALGPQDERFDAIVLCNGQDASALLGSKHGLALATLHEASVTAPLRIVEGYPDLGPRAALVDPARGLSIARIGQRVRVTGGQLITATGASARADHEALHRGLQHWYPGSVLHQQVQQGQSARPVTPDGLPLLGASAQPGLWLHVAPGWQGWGLACGSAHQLARLIDDRRTELDLTPLSPQRQG